jgi:hypothetical protein
MYVNEKFFVLIIFFIVFKDDQTQRMPLTVQRSVRKENIKFLHNKILFSPECFTFIKRLVQNNVQQLVNTVQQLQQFEDPASITNVNFDDEFKI